jgi:MoaA/NifB/PqqE/SkfB family radical SAM enzyme
MLNVKENLINSPLPELLNKVITNDALRGLAMKVAEKKSYQILVEKTDSPCPRKAQEEKFYILRNLLLAGDKATKNGNLSPEVRKKLLKLFIGKVVLGDNDNRRDFGKRYGYRPPGFLTISPGKACNLQCTGCYASSSASNPEKLDYAMVDRIIDEKTNMWGSHFTVISGGEPLMWRSEGKDILDIAEKHNDNYFLMYTNGTLISKKVAQRMAEVGNITPAISVEGFEEETDKRRGRGVHRRILRAFQNLREAGVPIGISVTAYRDNAEILLSDEFTDFYFNKQGVMYGWIFQYMPIGRKFTLDMMITPEQRVRMYEKEKVLLEQKKLFIADFWNSGALSNGCISAGRSGGYFYIDWNGDVMPCVFTPYSTHNIKEVYNRGGDLNTILNSPFFKAIRKWQRDYGYEMSHQRPPFYVS